MLTFGRSFGAVFKAKHKESGELVAIKRVILEDNDEIQKEIEILKDCSSPHIIKYYGHFQKDSDIFVSMRKVRRVTITLDCYGVLFCWVCGRHLTATKEDIHRT